MRATTWRSRLIAIASIAAALAVVVVWIVLAVWGGGDAYSGCERNALGYDCP
jgi:hypothetical protein